MPVSAETMRELDKMAARSGISTSSLMENAGTAVAKKATGLLSALKVKRIGIFCGKGNNGGAGLVAARKLKEAGFNLEVYLLSKKGAVKNEAAVNLNSFMDQGGNLEELISDADIERLKEKLDYSLIIDGLLGTGFSGSVSGILKDLIELLNSSGIPILSIDVPSGLNATTGEIIPIAIKAKWTISFALPKKGFFKKNGPAYTGLVQVLNIGFPEELLGEAVEYERKICTQSQ